MVIYLDIKPLIVTGFVLVLINSSDGYPLLQQRKSSDSGSYGRLTMLKKSCIDSLGNVGVCMFKWDCISQKGVTLSTCVDGFLFGACCSLKGESQDKLNVDSSSKSSTESDYEKSNTISLIKYVTLSYLQKTKSTIQEEEKQANITPSTNFNTFSVISLDDVTTESLDTKDTTVKFFLTGNTSFSPFDSSDEMLDVLSNASINSNYSYLNNVESEINTSDKKEEDRSASVFNFVNNFSKLEPESSANYSSENLGKTQHTDKLITTTLENEDFINLSKEIKKENKTNNENELKEPEGRTTTCAACNTVENDSSGETAESEPATEAIIDYDSFHSENNEFEFRDEIENDTLVNSAENFLDRKSYLKRNITLNNSKDTENFTTKDISPPVWEDYTSLFPSSFQALISQLTSREVSNIETSVLPTAQSNLISSKLNSNETEYAESFLSSNSNDNVGITNHQEVKYNQNIYYDKKHNMLTTTKGETVSKENSDIKAFENTNSTAASHQIKNDDLINVTNSLQIGNTHYNHNTDDNSFTPNENNEVVPIVTFLESDMKQTTNSLDLLSNNTIKELDVFCSEENELKIGNCRKDITSSANMQTNKPYSSSENSLKGTEDDAVSLIKSTLTPYITTNNEIRNYEEDEHLTTVSLDSGTMHSFNEKIPTLIDMSNGTKDNDYVEHDERFDDETADTELSFDQATLITSSFSNEEFLFDITTEVLTYFTKAEATNSEFSESYEPNLVLKVSEDIENFTFEVTEANLFTPSQIATQEIQAISTENITLINELRNSSSSKNSNIRTTENYEEKLTSIPASHYEFFTTDYKTVNSLDKEFSENDFVSTKNLISVPLTTNVNQYQENTFYDTSQVDDLSINLNAHSPNDITSQGLDLEHHITNSPYETESKYSVYENYQQGSTKFQNMPVTLDLWQNMISTYSEATTDPLVNMSILITTETISTSDTLYNHSNHLPVISSTNVDVFNDTDSNTPDINSTFPMHNQTISGNYTATSALTSSYSSVAEESFSTLKATQSETSERPVINNVWNYKKDCGVRPMQPIGRIVGGRNTYFGKWPWQALVKEATWLGLFVKNKCGGVLITSKYVLTAAHCQPGFLASLLVVLGTHDISNLKDNGAPVIRNVKRMVVHRHYNPQTFENDLALLEMDTELEFLPHVVPICLPHRYEDFTGEMAFVTGWGKLTHGGDVPNILQEVQVPIVANSECQMMFYQAGHHKAIQNNFVCAGYTNGGQDSCEGDSGGPLMVQRKDKRWVLVGTVSHGIGCADPNLPGVYMRMSSYRPWIDSIINK